MTALALREDQDYWDEKQLAVLRQTGIGEQVTSAELAAFLHLCQRTGLDPFARQIYLIGRWDKKAGREVFRPQTGIDGYRIVAQRTVERTKQSLGYEDTVWCGPDGQWTDVWLSADPPAAAKVVVLRDGKRFPAIARWSEYVPTDRDGRPTGLWVKRHAAQLEKCAEALALRKAFPNDMAGVYTSEEMEQADNPQQPIHATAEIVSEERVQEPAADPALGNEHWYANPSPEQEWLAKAIEAAPQRDLNGCKEDWQTSVKHVHDGKLTKGEAGRLQDILRPRIKALMDAQAEPDSEVVEAEIVEDKPAALDPEDQWAVAIREAVDAGQAQRLLDDARDQAGRNELAPERLALIEQAIEEAFPGLTAVKAEAA